MWSSASISAADPQSGGVATASASLSCGGGDGSGRGMNMSCWSKEANHHHIIPTRKKGPNPRTYDLAAAVAAPAPALSSESVSFRTSAYKNGLVTVCTNLTYDEVMRRRLIGLPRVHMNLVNKLHSKNSAIFLINMDTREMSGVFEADGAPGLDLEPDAWMGNGFNSKRTSRFPAQCRFKIAADFETPLHERHYRNLLNKDKHGKIRILSGEETRQLIKIFQTKSKLRKVTNPPPTSTTARPAVRAISTAVALAATIHRLNIDSTVGEKEKDDGAVISGFKKNADARRTCKRWLVDECDFGFDECKFLHIATTCRAFQRGTCSKRRCPYVHDKLDRDDYRHGRSFCQKTATHADDMQPGFENFNDNSYIDEVDATALAELDAAMAAAVEAELVAQQNAAQKA